MAAESAPVEAAADEMTLDEVTVTAERVTRDLQKTPQFISVKSGDQLKEEGKVRVEDILQGVQGFTIEPTNNGQDTQIFIRGISNAAAGVSIVVDGVSQAVGTQARANTLRATSLDVSQVAITRGVQNGAGTTALSGTISLVTNKPVFEMQAKGSFTTGSFRTQNTEGVLNMPLSSNQAIRLAFNTERRAAYTSAGLGDVDNRAFRLRYRWQMSDKLDINASFEESRLAGASNAANGTLATGLWQPVNGGAVFNYTNPYSGVTTQWGQQVPGVIPNSRQFYYTGNVLAGFTANNSATNTVGVGTLGISTTNTNLTTNNQYYYPAPLCVANTAFQPIVASTFNQAGVRTAQGQAQGGYTSMAAALTDLANLGPVSNMLGCPYSMMAVRTGVDWNQRRNPWDDGFRPGQFMNTPSNTALNRQGSITIDWSLPAGDLQIQPSFIYTSGKIVFASRGTGFNENHAVATSSYRLDSSFTSKMIGKFQYILGLNASVTPAPDDGYRSGGGSRTNVAPIQPWVVNNNGLPPTPQPPLAAFTGVAPNGGVVTPYNVNCYFVLPSVNAAGVVQATAKGVTNNTSCNSGTYSAGVTFNNLALSANLNYTFWDKLHVSGTGRYERFSYQNRPLAQLFLEDGDGQRYAYVVPQSTIAAATAANPNSPYAMPYRMNLSTADMQAMIDAYPALNTSFGAMTYTLNVQYDITPNILSYVRLGTGTSPSMNDDSSSRPQVPIRLVLPDAKVPQFGGNATAAAIARSGLPFEMTVFGPDPSSKLKAGDKTRQVSLGLKSRWFDNRLQFNVEGFYNEFTNKSVTFIVGAFPTDIFNNATNPTASQGCTNIAPTAASPFSIVLDPAGTPTSRGASCFNIYQPVGGGAGTGANWTGKMVSKGADFDITWTPTANDRLDVSLGLLRTAYLGSTDLPVVDANYLRSYVVQGSNTNDALLNYYAGLFNSFTDGTEGLQLANAPKMTINTTYQHRFKLANGWTITPRVQMNYMSAKYISTGGGGVPSTDGSTIRDANWAIDNGRALPTVIPTNRIWNLFLNFQAPEGKWFVNAYVNNVQNTALLAGGTQMTTYDVGSRATNDLQKIITGGQISLTAPRVIGVTIGAQL